jgi:DNA-binding NtrC family response regulator
MSRVLVVDADPGVLYWAKTWLQSDGLDLEVALTGLQGLDLARRQRPDLVLLDAQVALREPDAVAALRQLDAACPMILLTADRSRKPEEVVNHVDVFDRVVKPLDLRRLREVVERALEASRRRVPARLPNPSVEAPAPHAPAALPFHSATPAAPDFSPGETFLAPLAEFTRELLGQQAPELYRQIHREVDRVVLNLILRSVNGNQVKASEMLGISRTTLRSKLRSLRPQDGRHSS